MRGFDRAFFCFFHVMVMVMVMSIGLGNFGTGA